LKVLVWISLIIIAFGGIMVVVFKKMIMRTFGEISFANIFDAATWFRLFTNPWVILLLCFTLGLFALSMVAYSLEDVSRVMIITSGMAPIFFLINIGINKYFLKEALTSNQLLGIFFVVISMVFGFFALYFGGIKT